MTLSALLSLCFGVAVSVEEVREVPNDAADEVTSLVTDEIERVTGINPVLDHRVWSSCEEGARCLAEVRASTGESELLLLRLFGGPLSIQLVAEKIAEGSTVPARTVDLPKSARDRWRSMVAEMISAMFTRQSRADISAEQPIELVRPSVIPDWLDWVLIAGGVVGSGVAIGFAISSSKAKSAAEVDFLPGSDTDRHAARSRDHRNVAIASGVAGVVLTGAGVGLLIFD